MDDDRCVHGTTYRKEGNNSVGVLEWVPGGKVFDFLSVSFYLVASLYDFEASALLECITEKNGVMEYVTQGQTAIIL